MQFSIDCRKKSEVASVLLYFALWLVKKISRHSWSPAFSRAWGSLVIFYFIFFCLWFLRVLSFLLIRRCDNLWFWFYDTQSSSTVVIWKIWMVYGLHSISNLAHSRPHFLTSFHGKWGKQLRKIYQQLELMIQIQICYWKSTQKAHRWEFKTETLRFI